MISNATNPLKEFRKESLLRCAGSTSICVWLVCDLVVMCVQAAPRSLTLRDVSIQKRSSRISQLSITQNDIILQDTNL
jgi:hypothetical protein